MHSETFGTTSDGQTVTLFTLTNRNGLVVKVSNYGAALTECHIPDRTGTMADVTLGFSQFSDYQDKNDPFLGVVAGRYANRIAKGRFRLEGVDYELAINNGPNHLHGGKRGFDRRVWQASPLGEGKEGVRLGYQSPDGEEAYPGNLETTIEYELTDDNEFRMAYRAQTDRATPINLTNHAYWNLAGESSGSIRDHQLKIEAERYTPVDEHLIPTGEILTVANTPLDFRKARTIGERIDQVGKDPVGYDHNFVLTKEEEGALNLAATVTESRSGRKMEIFTTEPGIQLYTANFLDGTLTGKSGQKYSAHDGLCLECQHFPDSPNHPHFPSTILRPGQEYRQTTLHRFSLDGQ